MKLSSILKFVLYSIALVTISFSIGLRITNNRTEIQQGAHNILTKDTKRQTVTINDQRITNFNFNYNFEDNGFMKAVLTGTDIITGQEVKIQYASPPTVLTDESGNPILDESGNKIQTE